MNPKKSGARSRARWAAFALLAVAAAAGYYAWQNPATRGKAIEYRSALVLKGPITASVSASGTLTPVISVPVSSQVSGQVKEVLVDYNSEVRQGQLIARIDPETFEYRVRQAQADLEATNAQVLTAQANVAAARAAVSRAEVNLTEARRDFERKQQLVERGYISPAEIDRARAVVNTVTEDLRAANAQVAVTEAQARTAQATVRQRAAQLASANVDLKRTEIRAPVDGVVIRKSIDAGQTVAASLQAPEMFVIARDLRDMQVDTSVDESEIGRVRLGQRASFTIDSFPGRSFNGEVRQIRKAAVTVQNVVTYTVVVSAQNADLSLVPGMTANVRIVTDSRESVLKVPNAALRFRPPDFQEPQPGRADARSLPRLAADAFVAMLPAAHAQQAGGALAQFRERLERDLALADAQKVQLDAIFAGMREKFASVREAPEAERAKLIDRHRAELRERIGDILNPEQKKAYAEIVAEISNRQSRRGRVFVLDSQGEPKPVSVRLGLTDGSFTEVIGDEIREGDRVIVGTVGAAQPAPKASPGQAGPRLPF